MGNQENMVVMQSIMIFSCCQLSFLERLVRKPVGGLDSGLYPWQFRRGLLKTCSVKRKNHLSRA